ncbi:MAG: secretin N-terminal domain-containing protein [Roseibacillus sp.]
MKLNKLLFPSLLLSIALAHGQRVPAPTGPGNPGAEPNASPPAIDPSAPKAVDPSAPPFNPLEGNIPIGAPALPSAGDLPDVPPPPPPPGGEGGPGAAVDNGGQISEADGAILIRDAALNDILQMLAKRANKQYFHNTRITGPEFNVSGHLNSGNPLQQMEDLAFMYGLTLYQKGETVYALNNEQLNQLPATEWVYQLRYLRPTDIEQIKALIQPMLSPTGIVNYEPKTNTLIIIDSAHQVDRARSLLTSIDKAKGQIVIEVKILSINSSAAERKGVDWSLNLGAAGIPLETIGSLNSLFGIESTLAAVGTLTGGSVLSGSDTPGNSSIVLSPLQINGVLRALQRGGLVTQTSNPTLITEDNEQATISLIDRVPIITTTVNTTTASSQLTEEIRYSVDTKDPVGDPATTREIGVTVAVTPTLLPDGTIRMKMRPRSAQIVEYVIGQSGNEYPRVSESMIESVTRIPDGHSLIVGGFYGQVKSKKNTKVPFLGDLPWINFFFKSKEASKETTSLVFVVTPTSYDPSSVAKSCETNKWIRDNLSIKPGHDWIEDSLPGPAHLPDLDRTLKDLRPGQRDHQPSVQELRADLKGCCGSAKSGIRHGRLGIRKR